MKFQILIRSPSVPTPEDFTVLLTDVQTFKDLKQTIEREHPAAPRAHDMRLIWKGRVLTDEALVSTLYTGDPELPAPLVVHSVVHFVVSVSTSLPQAPKDGMINRSQKMACSRDGEAVADASASSSTANNRVNSSSSSNVSQTTHPYLLPTPSVVPLGNSFQYIMMDGTPYLVERKAQIGQRIASRLGPFNYESHSASGSLDINEFNSRMINQHREFRHRRQADPGQVVDAVQDNNLGNRNNGQQHQQQHPLAHAFRNITFDGVWSVIWLLLRGLLIIVVLAHDASWERVLMLLVLVYFFMLLRTNWAQRQLQQLRQYRRNDIGEQRRAGVIAGIYDNADNGEGAGRNDAGMEQQPADGQPQREFTAVEKARALVIALFTSLIPAEPFQEPIPVGED